MRSESVLASCVDAQCGPFHAISQHPSHTGFHISLQMHLLEQCRQLEGLQRSQFQDSSDENEASREYFRFQGERDASGNAHVSFVACQRTVRFRLVHNGQGYQVL